MLCTKASDSWVCAANALTKQNFLDTLFSKFFYINPQNCYKR